MSRINGMSILLLLSLLAISIMACSDGKNVQNETDGDRDSQDFDDDVEPDEADQDSDQAEAETSLISEAIDWRAFLGRSDPIWERLSDRWQYGAFTGNGMLGTMTYRKDERSLRFRLGRSDITAHYRIPFVDWSEPRVPIGDLLLTTKGAVQSENMRMHLYNAEVSGVISTDEGSVEWRVFTHASDMVIVLEIETDGNEEVLVSFEPIHGISPRIVHEGVEVEQDQLPPLPICSANGDVEVCSQAFLPGGDYATAWIKEPIEQSSQAVYLSIANGWPDGGAADQAAAIVRAAKTNGLADLEASHRSWWHAWWPRDFLSIPDANWEAFYWLQMYKHASATRPGRMLIDNQGPWLTNTPWPGAWWNLNVQLSYSPVYATNRLEQGLSLIEALNANIDNLKFNASQYGEDVAHIDRYSTYDLISWLLVGDVVTVYELGNLTWVLHNYWRHYRATMNEDMLREGLYPLLRLSVNLYLKMIEEGEDGRLHLPPTHSPEYGEGALPAMYADCTYALSLLRWGCETLLRIVERLGTEDPLAEEWQDVLERLIDLPTNENGLMIAAGQAFEQGHRHFSHLLSIFPLYDINSDDPTSHDLIDTSVSHWIELGERDGGFEGYSWVAASSIASMMGRGDQALSYLNRSADRYVPSTMYVEGGPVIETPLAAARSIQDMLLQSWGDTIRIFPAVPSTWKDVSFHDLRAEGAFSVSASRDAGTTKWIRIKSLAGEPCRIRSDLAAPIYAVGDLNGMIEKDSDNDLMLDLNMGDEVVLFSGEKPPEFTVEPVFISEANWNAFGIKGRND